MHYFANGRNIAAVEDADQAQKYADAGWTAITRDDYIHRWRIRDLVALYRLKVEAYHAARQQEAQAAAERSLVKFHGV